MADMVCCHLGHVDIFYGFHRFMADFDGGWKRFRMLGVISKTFRMQPEVSLPQVISPAPLRAMHPTNNEIFSVGRFTRTRPSASLPAFRQILSSLLICPQFSIGILVLESMSIPSYWDHAPYVIIDFQSVQGTLVGIQRNPKSGTHQR